jgi:hypothetical protein
MENVMNVLIVKFALQGIDDESYAALTRQAAPGIAESPGLITKMWLDGRESGQYGGVYLFECREAIDRYLASPPIAGFFASGVCRNVEIEIHDILEPASAITSGPLAGQFAASLAA